MWRRAVVYKAMLAEEALSAECLHIDGHTVASLDILHGASCLLNNANHLVANGNAWDSFRYASVFDVQVACADASQGHSDYGISRFLYNRYGLVCQGELASLYVCVCFHSLAWSLLLAPLPVFV